MSTGNIIAEQHCGSYKAFFWPVNWLLPPFERKRCLPVTDTHTYIQRKSQRLQTEYPHVDKLIGERNSRTTVSLGIFGNSLLLSVMSDWVVTLAQSVQQWRVTLIRKNRDRKAVSERERELRERESWERRGGKRGTEWAERKKVIQQQTHRDEEAKETEKQRREQRVRRESEEAETLRQRTEGTTAWKKEEREGRRRVGGEMVPQSAT